MAIPFNTTCDIYRVGSAPPAAPDVEAVPIWLTYNFDLGRERGERENAQFRFTASMLVPQGPRIKPSTFSEEGLKKTRDSAKDGMGNHGVAFFMEVTHGKVSPSFLASHPQILRCFA